ncbi:Transcription repressor OFP7 [Bienertia sinuspersici]
MGKGFIKFRLSRVIPTFNSCRSKDPSTLPTNPVPSFLPHSSTTTTTNTTTTATSTHHHPKPHRSSIKRHVSAAFLSARHGCLRPRPSPEGSDTQSSSSKQPPHHHFKWGKISHNYESTPPRRKIYNSAASDTDRENDVVYLPPPTTKISRSRVRKIRRRQRTSAFQKARISTSSDSGLFSEDEHDNLESETLVSTDSPKSNDIETKTKNKKKKRTTIKTVPARLSEFMRKMTPCKTVANGKVRESFAMVKKSEDPFEDFKRSMVEMVVENQMFEERELEELLRCFLSLNSERHHQAIVTAFTQIWKSLFCHSPSSH